jgi:7,8-dihydroneopterin aldolase/epimerase/oxygenase
MLDQHDRILMEGMIFDGHVGVHDFEKTNGQPFQADVILYSRHLPACETDQLDQTIDYGTAYQLVGDTIRSADCDLIEKLAGLIAENLLNHFPLADAVDVTVRKPQAPLQGRFKSMGVRILRVRG